MTQMEELVGLLNLLGASEKKLEQRLKILSAEDQCDSPEGGKPMTSDKHFGKL